VNDVHMLRREADCFARLLCGAAATPDAIDAYVDAHGHRDALHPASAFQGKLIRHASRGVFSARTADGYARFFDPRGPLRCKLVLMLAILESMPPTHRALDAPVGGALPGAVVRLVPYGLRAVFCIVLGILFFAPLRLVTQER
jgi:hypothetical protein